MDFNLLQGLHQKELGGIKKWDTEAADMLPVSMSKMKKIVQSYHVESKWRDEGYLPTFEEYMQIALFSSGHPTLLVISFLGIVESSTKEAIEWVQNFPKIVEASFIISRLMDDIASHTFEQERPHVASAVECYLKQFGGASKEEATGYFCKEIVNGWKDINEQCLKPTPVPLFFLERILNPARVVDAIYKDDDAYTNSYLLRDTIASVLMESLSF
ncbi:hypothetical protein K2173_019771 [Erythroxylum novogranatense]|uniref:Terpene synthase metal-binding domain-containing protein n=1 Tax=Erythroxylum novogranatense TaxID=1862640 RepID=A0AAV8SMB1_9ROSI|nr:hypothetical protein K2173_019771 [Erythroxylum novogranatense]